MASDTVSEKSDLPPVGWRGKWTVRYRILAVNIFTLVLFAAAILFLDAYRNQLRDERIAHLSAQARAAAATLPAIDAEDRAALLAAQAGSDGPRLRLYASDGARVADSWSVGPATYDLRDPETQGIAKQVARAIDRGFNAITGEDPFAPFVEPETDNRTSWQEVVDAAGTGRSVTQTRDAPDGTPVFSAATPVPGEDLVLLATINDRSYTRAVRRQRGNLAIALGVALVLSIYFSSLLSKTIVRPLRHLAIAAHRVRLGRSPEINVPRLPDRRDEIGTLARAVSDMSHTLRRRVDETEAFAADVAHELKNPLASLRSAVDSLERIDDPGLKKQLLDVVRQDVVRLDRLITEISEAARTDAELARTQFEPVDMGKLVGQLVSAWEDRRETGNARIAYARPKSGTVMVEGDGSRLARAIDNLLDNAISFSPANGLVEVTTQRVGDKVRVQVQDEGPGVPEAMRETIFNRFHSLRPQGEDFGRHSGLGLAIASAIVEGHDGTIDVAPRQGAGSGACFTILLPALKGR
ncbi:sensor histidine kinase [Sphingomicrobium clamense]|uniref:histidine kinase n=1 Tax=Sphingomicrobium clamense TaxID=2851013 RepID=A0ABS6V701_9SPHN|nr:HAMP domain-containing sensor histidine kinase [Sphingomicrobium sp. B8]MBW0144967.1 HAMP domain-containing histidine kinase [Sphingomicrobium sp. B8]